MFARSLPVLLTGALLATSVLAQTSSPASPPAATTTDAASATKPHPEVEKRIAQLRTTLKITPSETKAFDDFTQVMRENADKIDALVQERRQAAATMTAVDQMKAYQALAQAHADEMQRLVPAFSQLYEALTPEQQKTADEDFRNFSNGRPSRH
jgi:periplasmic protein CpxP/Spy